MWGMGIRTSCVALSRCAWDFIVKVYMDYIDAVCMGLHCDGVHGTTLTQCAWDYGEYWVLWGI